MAQQFVQPTVTFRDPGHFQQNTTTEHKLDNALHTRRSQIQATLKKSQQVCRICLEECYQKPYCKCKASHKMHEECLKSFLKQKLSTTLPVNRKCELCGHRYSIFFHSKCAAYKSTCARIREDFWLFVGYLLFFGLVLLYVWYLSKMLGLGAISQSDKKLMLTDSGKIIIYIVTGVLLLAFFIGVYKFLTSYFFTMVTQLDSIEPYEQQEFSLQKSQLKSATPYSKGAKVYPQIYETTLQTMNG